MKTNFIIAKGSRHKLIILLAILFTFCVSAFSQTKHIIEVSGNVFSPHVIEIMTGDTIEWINIEGIHNVNGQQYTFDSNPESFGNGTGSGWVYSNVFNTPGTYFYQCDVHAGFGMNGVVKVAPSDDDVLNIIVNFSNMNPHSGQKLWLSVVDKETGYEVDRESVTISQEFSVSTAGIESGHSYYVNFYADFNDNGRYDAPSVDHAWRLEVDNVTSDTTLNFEYNTNFADIKWQNRLTLYFLDMDPHIGQNFNVAVIEKSTGTEVDRIAVIADVEFSVTTYGIENGKSYFVNFYADYNENSGYDVPPIDHAWSIDLNNVTNDTILNFSHNAGMIADINWQNKLTINFISMDPHIGQNLWLAVIDKNSGTKIDSIEITVSDEFKVDLYGIENGNSYDIDFFADHNQNGIYDKPPVDHAWRLMLNDVAGDTSINFVHNTNFTDIFKTTSIKENNFDRLKVYPNPATDKVSIQSEKTDFDYALSLTDITGKTKRVNWIRTNQTIEVDLKNLQTGIYFLEIKNNIQRKVLKLIKE